MRQLTSILTLLSALVGVPSVPAKADDPGLAVLAETVAAAYSPLARGANVLRLTENGSRLGGAVQGFLNGGIYNAAASIGRGESLFEAMRQAELHSPISAGLGFIWPDGWRSTKSGLKYLVDSIGRSADEDAVDLQQFLYPQSIPSFNSPSSFNGV